MFCCGEIPSEPKNTDRNEINNPLTPSPHKFGQRLIPVANGEYPNLRGEGSKNKYLVTEIKPQETGLIN